MFFIGYADECDAIDRARDRLASGHLIVTWCERQRRGEFGELLAHEVSPSIEELLDACDSDPEDPLCAAMRLRLLVRHYDDLVSKGWDLPGASAIYDSLLLAGDAEIHPIAGLWVAEAALGLVHRLRPRFAAEMQMLAWRQGLLMAAPDDFLSAFFLRALAEQAAEIDNVHDAAYAASGRLALVHHLNQHVGERYRIIRGLINGAAAADLALADAHDNRVQDTIVHSQLCICHVADGYDLYRTLQDEGADDDAYEMLRMSGLGLFDRPLLQVADALLLVRQSKRAIEVLRFHLDMLGLDDDAEVRLLERVMASTR